MSELEALQKAIIRFRDERNWKQFHSPKDLALSLLIEAGELAEHFQWKTTEQCLEHIESAREELGDELADVLNILIMLANDLGIDLAAAARRKLAKNEARYPLEKSRGSNRKYTAYEGSEPGE